MSTDTIPYLMSPSPSSDKESVINIDMISSEYNDFFHMWHHTVEIITQRFPMAIMNLVNSMNVSTLPRGWNRKQKETLLGGATYVIVITLTDTANTYLSFRYYNVGRHHCIDAC